MLLMNLCDKIILLPDMKKNFPVRGTSTRTKMIVPTLNNVVLSNYASISSESVGVSPVAQPCFVKHTGKDRTLGTSSSSNVKTPNCSCCEETWFVNLQGVLAGILWRAHDVLNPTNGTASAGCRADPDAGGSWPVHIALGWNCNAVRCQVHCCINCRNDA